MKDHMIILNVGNSYSKLDNLNVGDHKELKDLLSYTLNPSYSFYSKSYGPTKKTLLSKRGEFPTGLLGRVIKWLSARPHQLNDLRVAPKSVPNMFKLKEAPTPYPDQINAVTACIEHNRGCVVMGTGSGKSYTMGFLIFSLQLKTLVVVPNLELKQQLTATFKLMFGDNPNVRVENIDSSALPKLTGFDCLILDEAHHSASKTYRELNKKAWAGIYHRYFFTATPFRSQTEENILFESVCGTPIYKLAYKDAVDRGYIVPLNAFYITIPKENPNVKTEYASYSAAYSRLIVNNNLRNHMIQELLLNFNASKYSTLCLIKEIKHGEILSADGAFVFISGQNDQRHLIEQFANGKIKTLVATTGIMGEGCDSKACEFVIIGHPVKSKSAFMQNVGRAFRRYPGKESATVILLRDTSHKYFRSAFREQCKILEDEYGVIPVELKTNS